MTDHDPAQSCTRVAAGELSPADPTPGMTRQVALQTETMWSGAVDTEGGAVSGWHHHGDHDTTLYIVSGRMRLESGPDGKDVVEAGPGDFLRVPAGAVHRESNPGGDAVPRRHRALRVGHADGQRGGPRERAGVTRPADRHTD